MGQVVRGPIPQRLKAPNIEEVFNSPWTCERDGWTDPAPTTAPEVASGYAELAVGGRAVQAQQLLRSS
jgi:hypothetical protein